MEEKNYLDHLLNLIDKNKEGYIYLMDFALLLVELIAKNIWEKFFVNWYTK